MMMTSNDASGDLKGKAREELSQAFEAAISAEEKLQVLEKMEQSGFEEKDLGSEYEELAKKFHSEGKFPEKVVYYGKKALDVYLDLEKSNVCKIRRLSIANTLYLLGAVCRELKRYDESLRYLNWSQRTIVELQEEEEEDNSGFDGEVLSVLDVTEFELLEVKKAMGKMEEVPVHMRKILELKLMTLEEGSLELGKAYKNAYVAYMSVMNTEEARPLCVKALEIYEKHLGGDSVEVAEIRVHLVGLYSESGEKDKALEQSRLAQSVFKKMGMDNELLEIQVQESQVLIALGRAEEAVEALTVAIAHGDLEPGIQANAHFFMAMANLKMRKHDDARNDLNIARKILEELDTNNLPPESRLKNSLCVAARCAEMSTLHEIVADFETAIYFARRVLAIPELPLKLLVDGSRRLALLLIRSGKAKQGISYLELENMMNKLENFGPQHSELGNAYEKLGLSYIDSKRDLAAKYVEYAKSIMDVSLGPEHLKSLKTSEALAITYVKLGRFPLAVEIQEKVVETLRGLGPSLQYRLDEALARLELIMSTKAGFEDMLASSPGFGVSDLVCMLDDIVESGMLGNTEESGDGEL